MAEDDDPRLRELDGLVNLHRHIDIEVGRTADLIAAAIRDGLIGEAETAARAERSQIETWRLALSSYADLLAKGSKLEAYCEGIEERLRILERTNTEIQSRLAVLKLRKRIAPAEQRPSAAPQGQVSPNQTSKTMRATPQVDPMEEIWRMKEEGRSSHQTWLVDMQRRQLAFEKELSDLRIRHSPYGVASSSGATGTIKKV